MHPCEAAHAWNAFRMTSTTRSQNKQTNKKNVIYGFQLTHKKLHSHGLNSFVLPYEKFGRSHPPLLRQLKDKEYFLVD